MPEKVLLWDFDGTLAYREGGWTGTLVEILRTEEPGLAVDREQLRPHMRHGFPWHEPEIPHPEIQGAAAWWSRAVPRFAAAFVAVGIPPSRATELAAMFPARYCDLRHWHLFDDTVPVLTDLSRQGWLHVVLSNHVPELGSIIAGLGILPLLHWVHNSAIMGYEKPHPEAFRIALAAIPAGAEVWMIGDNPVADVAGAEAMGIPAILVRKADDRVQRQCADLLGVRDLLSRPV